MPGPPKVTARWEALGWLLEEASAGVEGLPGFALPQGAMTAETLAGLKQSSDRLARRAATFPWTTDAAKQLLQRLASSGGGIRELTGAKRQVSRAEVVAQGMDRLLVQLKRQGVTIPGASQKLDTLFADVRVPDNFNAAKFCKDLDEFSGLVGRL